MSAPRSSGAAASLWRSKARIVPPAERGRGRRKRGVPTSQTKGRREAVLRGYLSVNRLALLLRAAAAVTSTIAIGAAGSTGAAVTATLSLELFVLFELIRGEDVLHLFVLFLTDRLHLRPAGVLRFITQFLHF